LREGNTAEKKRTVDNIIVAKLLVKIHSSDFGGGVNKRGSSKTRGERKILLVVVVFGITVGRAGLALLLTGVRS
jgi:hypothetical protein